MSSLIKAATRRRTCLLASTFLVPVLSLGISAAKAQQASPDQLPPIEVSPPVDADPNPGQTRQPTTGRDRTAPRRTSRKPATRTARRPTAPSTSNAPTNRQFAGIVGASTTVITAEDIAHSPAQTVQEIIAQMPGVQLTTLYGGVNGAGTTVDIRGFGAFATANTLVLINGRRLNDIDLAGRRSFDHSARFDRAHRNHPRQQRRRALWRQRRRRRHQHRDQDRRWRPAGLDARRSRRRLVQPAHGFGFGRDQFGAVVDVVLCKRDQVRRISGQQRARPAQRDRRHPLHDTRFHGLLDLVRRRSETRISRRPERSIPPSASIELVTDRKGTDTPFDFANKQGANATAGFTKTLWNGAELIVDGGVRNKKQQAGFFGTDPLLDFNSSYVDTTLQTWSLTPRLSIKNPMFGLPSTILTGVDYYDATYHSRSQRVARRPPLHVYDLVATDARRLLAADHRAAADHRFLLWRRESSTPA